jgi:hypothetical protein
MYARCTTRTNTALPFTNFYITIYRRLEVWSKLRGGGGAVGFKLWGSEHFFLIKSPSPVQPLRRVLVPTAETPVTITHGHWVYDHTTTLSLRLMLQSSCLEHSSYKKVLSVQRSMNIARFQASAALQMRSALFWGITQCRAGTGLPLYAALYPRIAQFTNMNKLTDLYSGLSERLNAFHKTIIPYKVRNRPNTYTAMLDTQQKGHCCGKLPLVRYV